MDYFNWNEDCNSSAYYNQPVQEPPKNTFGMASCICGILALATMCTGILPIPFGSLSILFAVLGHRKGKSLDTPSIAGIALSVVGLLFSAFIIFYAFKILPTMLENEAFREQMNTTSQQIYGIDLDDLLENYYDMGILAPQERTGE